MCDDCIRQMQCALCVDAFFKLTYDDEDCFSTYADGFLFLHFKFFRFSACVHLFKFLKKIPVSYPFNFDMSTPLCLHALNLKV